MKNKIFIIFKSKYNNSKDTDSINEYDRDKSIIKFR